MAPPLTLFATLLLAFAAREVWPNLPGSGDPLRLLPFALLLLLPTLLAASAARLARRELLTAVAGGLSPRLLLRLSAVGSPLAVYALFTLGRYDDCIEAWAWNSHLGRMLLTVAPVFVAELPRQRTSTMAQVLCEMNDHRPPHSPMAAAALPRPADVEPTVRLRLGWPAFIGMPLLLLGVGLDLLQWHRGAYVFTVATGPGAASGGLTFLLLTLLLLPGWFCVAFGARASLPEPPGQRLRAVAAQLGFPPHGVMQLPTGMRSLNAMMIGPLPLSRRLCITDGLLGALDTESLAGVVAHEVGHAKRGHPALLLTLGLGLLLLAILLLRELGVAEWDPMLHLASMSATLIAVWLLVRAVAHHFEHEADAASVQALGSGPCCEALGSVSRIAMPLPETLLRRLFSLHPTEAARMQHMRRYETQPPYRADFERRGRRLRFGVVGIAGLVFAAACWSWSRDWPMERVLWHLYSGNVVAAKVDAAALGEVPPYWRELWDDVSAELAVATEVAPTAADWGSAQPAFASAWAQGERVLLERGPAAARPWMALALAAEEQPTDVRRAVHAYCAAAAAKDPDRMEALKLLVQQLGIPAALQPVFSG